MRTIFLAGLLITATFLAAGAATACTTTDDTDDLGDAGLVYVGTRTTDCGGGNATSASGVFLADGTQVAGTSSQDAHSNASYSYPSSWWWNDCESHVQRAGVAGVNVESSSRECDYGSGFSYPWYYNHYQTSQNDTFVGVRDQNTGLHAGVTGTSFESSASAGAPGQIQSYEGSSGSHGVDVGSSGPLYVGQGNTFARIGQGEWHGPGSCSGQTWADLYANGGRVLTYAPPASPCA